MMDRIYKKFLSLSIDLAPVGVESRKETEGYFCTPKGASVFGWAGVDGIHFCFVRGFGGMVFSVSPMNTAPNYVHPLAKDFKDFLRLLLACGDAAALEQAWMWDRKQFEAFLEETPPTREQEQVLAVIAERMGLTAMEQPWEYIKTLQAAFDYRRLKYTEDCDDPVVDPSVVLAVPEWKVYFDGDFLQHRGRAHAGKELRLETHFRWADHEWLIPAAYLCSKGIVMDFCMRVDTEEILAFRKKRGWTEEHGPYESFTCEQKMQMELDDPLNFNFSVKLEVNGQMLHRKRGCSVSFDPYRPRERAAKRVLEHYNLDAAYGWVFYRWMFPWRSKRHPGPITLSAVLEQRPERIPGPCFQAHAPGDTFTFRHPVHGKEYTLTVRELEKQTLPQRQRSEDRWFVPTHFTAMSYVIAPEPTECIMVSDCDEGDWPLEIAPENESVCQAGDSSAACIGIIGGADGPTALIFGGNEQEKQRAACSSLHFEPTEQDVTWHLTFYEKRFSDIKVILQEKAESSL